MVTFRFFTPIITQHLLQNIYNICLPSKLIYNTHQYLSIKNVPIKENGILKKRMKIHWCLQWSPCIKESPAIEIISVCFYTNATSPLLSYAHLICFTHLNMHSVDSSLELFNVVKQKFLIFFGHRRT